MLRARGSKDGVVLNMTMSGDGIWNAIYSVPVVIGQDQQHVMLSVDTGSSDIWLASTACSTSACASSHATLYDPTHSVQTGQSVNLTYLRGAASGPVVWDAFTLGPYTIPSQALAAANLVSDEYLSPDFVGLLGLALPPNSLIAHKVPPTMGDSPDGATLQENIFGLTPVSAAPAHRFFGISLERPGTSRIPSLLSIGRHPDNLIPGFDPSTLQLMDLVASRAGDTFWRVSVDSVTGWIDGAPKPIALGTSSVLLDVDSPVAIVDTGGSGILTTRDIANGIYGAWKIGPGQDGNYYVPCTTPINLSIGLGQLPPIPLHPLDITAPHSSPDSTPTCLGLIQASDNLVNTADLVLGIPFLRNVYAVLTTSLLNTTTTTPSASTLPRLGLVPLTDPVTALAEFHNVRVLGQPLDPDAASSPGSSSKQVTVGKKLSVGVTVLLGIVGFFVACGVLFGVRWWVLRRRFKRGDVGEGRGQGQGQGPAVGVVARDGDGKKGMIYAESSTGSDWTRVDASRLKKDSEDAEKEKEALRLSSLSRSSVESPPDSDGEMGHVARDAVVSAHEDGDHDRDGADRDSWAALKVPAFMPKHSRTMSELDMGATGLYGVPLLDKGGGGGGGEAMMGGAPWMAAGAGARVSRHGRMGSGTGSTTTGTGTVTFVDERDMAGVGARGSGASWVWEGGGGGRARIGMGRGGSASEAEAGTWMGSRWTGEVGEVMEPPRRRAVEGEGGGDDEWIVER